MRVRAVLSWFGGAGLSALLLPAPVFAHAFGQQYTLPLPVSLYIVGAGAALVASFVILSFFSAPHVETAEAGHALTLPQALSGTAMSTFGRAAGLLLLAAAITTGFFGSQDVTKNPALFLFWVGLMLVMTYVSAIVAGVWERVDPFRALVAPVFGEDYRPLASFPTWLRYVLPLLTYYWILWFELLSYGAGASPANVALFLLVYVIMTYFGVGVFGASAWFMWGDFFSVFFRLIGKFAPLSIEKGMLRLVYPGKRLADDALESPVALVFILLALSSTAFDGLRDTTPWVHFFAAHPALQDEYGLLLVLSLIASPFVFLVLYGIAIVLMRVITGTRGLMLRFAYSLIPIAIAYSVAHYFSLVVSEGQNLIPMLSDPLGRGWDIFGTIGYQYNPALLAAQTVWYTQVSAIVIGHIAATFVAHRIAQRTFSSRTHVIVSQLPMLALMVLYTGFGLWILSLPYAA